LLNFHWTHRHLSNIDCLIAHILPTLFASLVLLMTTAKNSENALEDVALVAGTQQNLSNLYSFY